MEINALIESFGGTTGALATWHALPVGVRSRIAQGYDRLTGRFTRKWDVADKRENAELADETKRAGNQADAQRAVLQLLVPEIAKEISGDPELLNRAMLQTMGDTYRKQQNKDAVAESCLKDMAEKPHDHSEAADSLDEDWLNMFSSYAEKASSAHARNLFGHILSGEVRRPGSLSLSTIRCLSEIDQKIATLFTNLSSLISNHTILISTDEKNKKFQDLLDLQEAGLITGVDSSLSSVIQVGDSKTAQWYDEHLFLNIQSKDQSRIAIPCIILTKPGRELLTLIDRSGTHGDRIKTIYNAIPRHNIESFSIHLITQKSAGQVHYQSVPIKKWPEDNP